MRAFVILGPGKAEVQEVDPPVAGEGGVVVDVERAGICGTDAEFFSGEMEYLHTAQATYPMRIGHEWVGRVSAVGKGVDSSWVGRRVTGDTMLGCQRCARCHTGRQHLCEARHEIGIRYGWPGARAVLLPAPEFAPRSVPDKVHAAARALIEPGANCLRAVDAAAWRPGGTLLVLGTGTIGVLVAQIARARELDVHVMGVSEEALSFPRSLGFHNAWTRETVPDVPFDAVVDASNASQLPALAASLVEPGGRVVYIGLAGEPSYVDSRTLVFKDVTAVGILSGSPGLSDVIDLFASGLVDPRPLVAAVVSLDEVSEALQGKRLPEWGPGPKIHVDPHR
jgi:threonine dehydrogenase-like Zn-dependent dehydrogenase